MKPFWVSRFCCFKLIEKKSHAKSTALSHRIQGGKAMKGSIPRQFIDDLLTKSNIVDVIKCACETQKAGRDYQACCPFHHEKTPSLR